MLKKQAKYFDSVAHTNAHDERILNAHPKDDREFAELLKRVYSHPRTNYNPTDHIFPVNSDDEFAEIPTGAYIATRFYEDYFCPVSFVRATPINGKKNSGYSIEMGEFFKKVVWQPSEHNANRVSFLTSTVGVGKTAIINYYISIYKNELIEDFDIIPIYFDIDVAANHEVRPVHFLIQRMIHTIYEQINTLGIIESNTLDNLYNNCTPINHETPSIWESGLLNFIKSISEILNKRLFIAIDNIDFLYHKHDRQMFAEEFGNTQKDILRIVKHLVTMFAPGQTMETAGVNILFIMREDIHKYITHCGIHKHYQNTINDSGYRYVLKPSSLHLILQKRKDLFKEMVEHIKKRGKKLKFAAGIERIHSDLDLEPSEEDKIKLFDINLHSKVRDALGNLSMQGHRQALDHIAQFGWITDIEGRNSKELSHRFLRQQYPMLLAFITGGYRRYSQFSSRFPNLYLVYNSAYRENEIPERLMNPHRHSYWLKRLMLEYIAKKGKHVKPQTIYDIFCEDDDYKGYEKHIVELILGSLCQADSAFTIEVNQSLGAGESLTVEDIKITPRGAELITNHLADTFLYLQLIVDDHLMPLPKCVSDKLRISSKNIDYGYLTSPGKYRDYVKQMVVQKASRVFIFLEVLEVSLDLERELYPDVFEAIEMDIELPDPVKIKQDILSAVSSLKQYLKFDGRPGKLQKRASKLRPLIETQLRTAYGL